MNVDVAGLTNCVCKQEAFKSIVDKYVPKNWKYACAQNVNAPSFPAQPEIAGYE